ncbi:MAG: CRISPR-associated endonuclease Cas2 [Thermoguttaceae bacterium]
MRRVFIIAYDICLPKRYRQIYKLMKGHGDRLQFSVFRCELTEMELQELKAKVWPNLNFAEDRVMIVELGPVSQKTEDRIEFWGFHPEKKSSATMFIV